MKLDALIQERIVQGILAGDRLPDAAIKAGVAAFTAQEWLRRGKGEDPDRDQREIYQAFAVAVETAEAKYVSEHVENIRQSALGHEETVQQQLVKGRGFDANGNPLPDQLTVIRRYTPRSWRASAHILAKRRPDEWGKKVDAPAAAAASVRVNIAIAPQVSESAKNLARLMTKEELLQLHELLSAANARAPKPEDGK